MSITMLDNSISQVTMDLMTNHNTVVKTLDHMHYIFATDGYDIYKEWSHFLSKASFRFPPVMELSYGEHSC